MSGADISRVECGWMKPYPAHAVRLAAVLGLRPEELLEPVVLVAASVDAHASPALPMPPAAIEPHPNRGASTAGGDGTPEGGTCGTDEIGVRRHMAVADVTPEPPAVRLRSTKDA